MSDAIEAELHAVLPADLPRRAAVIAGATEHARLLLAANETLNLTRITSPRELAVKHVLDSLLPWRRFLELFPESAGAPRATLADLGSGGGYPGVLLALLLPHVQVTLIESIGKKAAFLREVVAAMKLDHVTVESRRGEEWLADHRVDVLAVRAVDSARELLRLLKPLPKRCGRLVLYKGQDVDHELAQAASDAQKQRLAAAITFRGALPDGGAVRCLLEYSPQDPPEPP